MVALVKDTTATLSPNIDKDAPPPLDESHIDADSSKARLEKALPQRPEKHELVDRNILKGDWTL